ncbi:MAG: ATP-grasp domain-containing protein, partial [Candidatus Muirbacterium halophilum]|nr:ATP-grasp domain-containing protein [Candidatus Muirbacterium halophilum]
NKISMRKKLSQSRINQPKFVYSDELKDILNKRIKFNLKFPLVLKPSENMGARGVIKVNDDNDIIKNFEMTQKFAQDKNVILEEFMEGPELSVECIILNKKCYVMVIGDRHIEKEPYFVETGHSCPSRVNQSILNEIPDFMQKAANSLGIYNGPCKGDIKICNGKLMIGEIAGRLSGGFMSSHTLPISTGIDALKIAIKQRLGLFIEDKELIPSKNIICIERAIIPQQTGIIKKISNTKKALKIPGVEFIHYNLKSGDKFGELVSNIGKVGNVIISAEDFEQANKIYQQVLNTIKVELN